jgi:phosphoribosylamine--glycine ligase
MGDPETEVVLPRIKTDLITLLEATANQNLDKIKLEIDTKTAATVMLVSGGYPENYEKGKVISGLDTISDSIVFHAGTLNNEDRILTNGGRVLAITSMGTNYKEALEKSYNNIEKLHFDEMNFRSDIGFDLT